MASRAVPASDLPPDIPDLGTSWIADLAAYQYATRQAIQEATRT